MNKASIYDSQHDVLTSDAPVSGAKNSSFVRQSLQNPAPLKTESKTAVKAECLHCGDRIPLARQQSSFCCEGCSSVYQLLHELNLDQEYYGLRGEKRTRLKPIVASDEDFSALDESPYRPKKSDTILEFFLEGIHCTACVWVLERLPSFNSDVEWSRLDMGRSVLKVKIKPQGYFESVAKLLLSLGYRPHALLTEAEATQKLNTQDQKTLRRMGVAAFSAMNVMIYSISLYSGVDGSYAHLFRWLSVFTALPALTYSAWPFYVSAYRALKSKRVSIDFPIALAFIGGFFESLRQIVLGTNLLYLDSITSLVFLMLLSRYALSRLERAELSKAGLLHALLPTKVSVIDPLTQQSKATRTSFLKVGQIIELNQPSRIPADGVVLSGEGWVDQSILTGESNIAILKQGDTVYAGCFFTDGNVRVKLEACGRNSRLGKIEFESLGVKPKNNTQVEQSDRWAQMFLMIVMGFALVLVLSAHPDYYSEALRRALALIIIACPCALALATPLTLARAYRLAVSQGILIRDTDVFERAQKVKHIIFDKTGTLTYGQPVVKSWLWVPSHNPAVCSDINLYHSIAYTLELRAKHPYAKAIVRYLEDKPGVSELQGLSVNEKTGFGVTAEHQGNTYQIIRQPLNVISSQKYDSDGSWISFQKNGVTIADICMQDEIRFEAQEVIHELKTQGYKIHLLSGDSHAVVERVSHSLGISHYKGELSPEQKMLEIQNLDAPAIAIGDGINDTLLLKKASIGIAFNRGDGSSIENTLTQTDVVLTRSNLKSLIQFLGVSKKYKNTLLRNALFSTLYNLAGGSFAALGLVHPLVAAVAMPVSAFTVFISTVVGLRKAKNPI